MKLLFPAVVFALCILFVNAQLNREVVENIRGVLKGKLEACVKKVNAKSDTVSRILYKYKIPQSHEGKCALFCLNKAFNGQNKDGSPNLDGALKTISFLKNIDKDVHHKIANIFKKCADAPTSKDPCIRASNMISCVFKKGRAIGLDKLIDEAQ